MLPAIGLMIAAYAVFRILTDFLLGSKRFPNATLYGISIFIGVIALLVIGIGSIDLFHSAITP